MKQHKKVVTCDIDGVLTDYPTCWLKYLQEKCGIYYKTTEEAKRMVVDYSAYKDMYRESEYKASLPINKCNRDALIKLSEEYDIIFATSRPINEKKYPHLYMNTFNWLLSNGLIFKELRYKDEKAAFIDGLDIAFHIDDEVKYANSVAQKEKMNNNCGFVYLLTRDDQSTKDIEDNVTIVKNIQEILDTPFFSVCIPATNRGDTIYRALKSIAGQTFRNFELVIVDCESDDDTVLEIERFFDSSDYRLHTFRYVFEKRKYKPKGTEDWNEPLKLARGKYIAMLEGDDYWYPNHLMNAYDAILKNPNIGLYGASNITIKRPFHGVLSNKDAKRYCYSMKEGVVPPSEAIFIRCNKYQSQFLYNSDCYEYSPEAALYVDIVLEGYDLFYSRTQDVFREQSTNPDKMKTWYYFADRFTLIDYYRKFFSKKEYIGAIVYNVQEVFICSLNTKSLKKSIKLLKSLSKKTGYFLTFVGIVSAIPRVLFKIIIVFFRLIKKSLK